jgi:hypothetical protein
VKWRMNRATKFFLFSMTDPEIRILNSAIDVLFIPQGFDGIEHGSFSGWIESKEYSYRS